jgi:hypothetical protein
MKDELRRQSHELETAQLHGEAQLSRDFRLPWHAPRITRIEIKQTLLQAGSMTDFDGFTN